MVRVGAFLLTLAVAALFGSMAVLGQIDNPRPGAGAPITVSPTPAPVAPVDPAPVVAPDCSLEKVAEVLRATSASEPSVEVACNLSLSATDRVTKQILITGSAASGVTIDCNRATIDGVPGNHNGIPLDTIRIASERSGGEWNRPEHITIRECQVIGRIRVIGMDQSLSLLQDSSRERDHVAQTRNAAPRYIVLDEMTITGLGRTPLFVGYGVTYLSLTNSEINGGGSGGGSAIYLDAESGYNLIYNNYIHINTDGREQVAVDASNYNRILNNRFSGLNNGGIFLYRNCGERSVIRHTTPSNNTIVNNFFYYNQYSGPMPAVWIGARNRNRSEVPPNFYSPPGYCDDDDGYDLGSSASDLDFARNNVVMQNRINKRSVDEMILAGHSGLQSNQNETDTPNFVAHNTTTSYSTVPSSIGRAAGCFVPDGYRNDFLLDGQRISLFANGANGAPACGSFDISCNDGERTYAPSTCEPVATIRSGCQVEGNNAGCSRSTSCDADDRIIGVAAACNLESGSIGVNQLNGVPTNNARVLVPSDVVSNGRCFVGSATELRSGTTAITGVRGLRTVVFGCSEQDANGGDCHIRVVQYCQ